MLDPRKTGALLADLRRDKGMTQQQVADALGVTFQAVSKWENGSAYPGAELLLGLAGLLGVTVDEILRGRRQPGSALSYSKAGVDIAYTDAIKSAIAPYLDSADPRVLNGLGPFASLYDIAFPAIEHPVLVLKAEEPGTKQKIAAQHGYMESVCHDMINHLVNDIAVMGARPLAVLDAIVCGSAEKEIVTTIVKGISEACRENQCALVGGELSIQPGVVHGGLYILTASVAGIVDRTRIIDGSRIEPGDTLLAVASNGLHTNGYSLIRLLMEETPAIMDERIGGQTFLEAVMAPHLPYYPALKGVFDDAAVRGMAHITGGGIPANLRRIIPQGLCASVDLARVRTLPIFQKIKAYGGLPDEEMLRTFNCGVGLILVVSPEGKERVIRHIARAHACYEIGEMVPGEERVRFEGRLAW